MYGSNHRGQCDRERCNDSGHGVLRLIRTLQGPAGEEWKEEIDGESPELSPLGRPLADGLSLACRDSYVVRNVSNPT